MGRVDPQVLGEEPAERVNGGVRREQVATAQLDLSFDQEHEAHRDQVPDALVQERGLERPR